VQAYPSRSRREQILQPKAVIEARPSPKTVALARYPLGAATALVATWTVAATVQWAAQEWMLYAADVSHPRALARIVCCLLLAACSDFKKGADANATADAAADAGIGTEDDQDAGDDARTDAGKSTDAGPKPDGGTGPKSDGGAGCNALRCNPEVVAGTIKNAKAIHTDASWLFVSDGAKVFRCAKDKCPAPLELGSGTGTHLYSDGLRVYWNDTTGVKQCPVAGCNGAPTTFMAEGSAVTALSGDNARVYWALASGVVKSCPTGNTCTSAKELGTGQGPVSSLDVRFAQVYWGSPTKDALMYRLESVEVMPSSLAPPKPQLVACQGSELYFARGTDVFTCFPAGGSCFPRAVGTSTAPSDLAVASSLHLFFRDNGEGKVYRSQRGGRVEQMTFAEGQPGRGLAVDDAYVYWGASLGVVRAPR
jgi:hypothetical protein